jgi:hypothetical protein
MRKPEHLTNDLLALMPCGSRAPPRLSRRADYGGRRGRRGLLRLPASDPVASLVVHGATGTSSHFYRGFAQDFGAVTADPTRRVRLPRPQQRAGVFPTAAQLKRLTENSRKPTGRW